MLGAGQQLQSGIENEQLGLGVRGGFANIGSTADVQDRLGVQLAQLGSQAQATRERKRDMAAQAAQSFQDAQTDFQNAQARARMAIEAGDSDLALSMINQAMQAKTAAAEAERQMYAGIIGTAGTIGGAMVGGPAGAAAGSQAGNVATGGGAGGYSLGANTDYGQPADFGVGDTGAQYSNTTYANARRRGLY
jgi:multidrug efflux pump subunit AcrA (membrane-fusion protein)